MAKKKKIRVHIIGAGEIGIALAKQLVQDDCAVTIVDINAMVVKDLSNTLDVICYQGNGASYETLQEAGAADSDIFIAVTDSDELNVPTVETACSKMDLDTVQFSRTEARKLREMTEMVSSLRIPKVEYELNVPMEVDEADVRIIRTLDDILHDRIPELNAMSLMESVTPVTSHKKAYQLLDIRRQTNIDLDSTFYIGGDNTDFQALDLVRDSGGVAVSFNGTDFAVRGSTIAILSKDSTVGAVFAEQFFSRGIESVLDLARNWDRKYLKETEFPDRNLVDAMLAAHPRKLPEVYIVDRKNVDEVAAKSAAYRKKLLGP